MLADSIHRVFPDADYFERLEWATYDWRVRHALSRPPPVPVATNLGAVFISEEDLRRLNQRPERYYWPLPRHLHGDVVRALSARGAKVIGFDVLFLDQHPSIPEIAFAGSTNSSDGYFAKTLAAAGNVVLAASPHRKGERVEGVPLPLLATNAARIGLIRKAADADGSLRRMPVIEAVPGVGATWGLGVAMAAVALDIDLQQAEIRPGRITLRSRDGRTVRNIPVGQDNTMLIDWFIPAPTPTATNLAQVAAFQSASYTDVLRLRPPADPATRVRSRWQDRVVLVSSIATGANVRDVGPSPLGPATILPAAHWNVANSLLTGAFVRRTSHELGWLLILAMTVTAGWISLRFRALYSSAAILLVAAVYAGACLHAYVCHRLWLPIVMPIGGALLMTHVVMVAYRAYLERSELSDLRSLFGKIVAPDVLDLVLHRRQAALNTTRQEVVIMFADLRGFTEFTDAQHNLALQRIQTEQASSASAQRILDEVAADTMATVNHYLSLIAGQVKHHHGTLDKYIGDSVMAFWGAPTAVDRPVAGCVRAAIAIQTAVADSNSIRRSRNHELAEENRQRAADKQLPLSLGHLFQVGIGINAGQAGVGFMGSADHLSNFTVFGREVNIASRVEGQAASGQILLTGAALRLLQAEDPELAARCRELAPIQVKGIHEPVPLFEVRWQEVAHS